jgi:hypothetical protein
MMKHQPKNKAFKNIFWVGFTFLSVIFILIVLSFWAVYKTPEAQSNASSEIINTDTLSKNPEKKLERIVIHDTVKVPVYCKKKHCPEPTITNNTETKETTDSIN